MNKKTALKGIVTLFSLMTLAACGNSAAANEEGAASGQKETLIVGLDDTFAPMGFRDDNNEIVGFDVDLAKEVGERLDIEMQFQPIDWAMKETELNTGNIDVVWNGYAITPERAEKVTLSEPYMENAQIIVVKKDSGITKKSDLEGKLLATQQSSSSIDKIKEDPSGIYNKLGDELVLYPTNNNAFLDLEAGRVDAIVVGEVYGRYYIKESGKDVFAILEEDFGAEETAVAIQKGNTELKEKIDQTLNEMRADGTYDEIYGKWFYTE